MLCAIIGVTVVIASDAASTYSVAVSIAMMDQRNSY